MGKYASEVVRVAQSWVGKNEKDGSFKEIIDIYNGQRPLPRNYKLKVSDEWCAGTVSAIAIKLGYTDIIPTECSCQRMIEKFAKIGIWQENENVTPKAGWIIFYDWSDGANYATTDNKAWADHVGIVEHVSGNSITVIEGNKNEVVARRTLNVNGKYIRGYGVPKYDAEAVSNAAPTSTPTTSATTTTPTTSIISKKTGVSAKSFSSALSGTYKVTALWLNVRTGAGTSYKSMVTIPRGTEVKNYGYYTSVNGVKWLLVMFTYKNVTYTGFASSKYLVK